MPSSGLQLPVPIRLSVIGVELHGRVVFTVELYTTAAGAVYQA